MAFTLDNPLIPIATANKLNPSISSKGVSPSANDFIPGPAANAAIPNPINLIFATDVKASNPLASLDKLAPVKGSNIASPSAKDFIPGPATNAAAPKRSNPGAPNNRPTDAKPAAAPKAVKPPATPSISVKPMPAKACIPSPINLRPYPTPIIPGVAINAAAPNANSPTDAININGNATAKAADIIAIPVPTPTNPANPTPDSVEIAPLIILNARLIPNNPGVANNAAAPIATKLNDPAIKNGLAKLNAIPNIVNDPATASKLPALISNRDLSPHASKAIGTAAIAAATPKAVKGIAANRRAGEIANIDNARAPSPNAIPAICIPLISLNPLRPEASSARPGPAISDAAPNANNPKDPAIKNGVANVNPIPSPTSAAVMPNICIPLISDKDSIPLPNISNPEPIDCIPAPNNHRDAPINANAAAPNTIAAAPAPLLIIAPNPNTASVSPTIATPAFAKDSHSTLLNCTNALLRIHNDAAIPAIASTPFST